MCLRMADSLCYTAEANTPLQSNYTPIKMLKKKSNNKEMMKYLLEYYDGIKYHAF